MSNNQSDHKVNLEENGRYRVALELAQTIATVELSAEKNREYYLRLYRQCYDTVYGYKSIEDVVNGTKTASAWSV